MQMMMNMFSSFMGQMSNILMAQYPMPTFPSTYPHVPYTSSMPSAVSSYNGFMSDPSNALDDNTINPEEPNDHTMTYVITV